MEIYSYFDQMIVFFYWALTLAKYKILFAGETHICQIILKIANL